MPSRQPARVITRASPMIRAPIWRPEYPKVLSTAYSPIRSLVVMAMVFATTAMMITITRSETGP